MSPSMAPDRFEDSHLRFRRAVPRRRWNRGFAATGPVAVIGLIGLVVLVLLLFAGQRRLAERDSAAAVSDDLQLARAALGVARDADRDGSRLATQAFRAFDAGHGDDGERMWEQARTRRASADRAYRDALLHAESAFLKDPARTDIRDLMGDILIDRAALAAVRHDLAQHDELIERVALYDRDASRRARRLGPGRLVVRAPPGAAITIEPTGQIASGTADLRLPPGTYTVVIKTPGRMMVRAPIRVEPADEVTIDAAPPRIEDAPAAMIYVPGGDFLYGQADEQDRLAFFNTTPLRRRSTAAFLIGRTEVTMGDWLAYLEALPPTERAALLPSIPSKATGALAIQPDGAGHWRIDLMPAARRYTAGWNQPIAYTGRKHQAVQTWQRFPILGVSATAATAYATWLDRTGRLPGARLCSEVEWERAARGADGRPYPGGDTLGVEDANIDVTHGYALMGPDEVGSHPASRSPFGLDDMSGNALEWTVSELGGFILRGGSYWYDKKTAHLTNRSYIEPTAHEPTIGFRLCATPQSLR